MDSFQKDIDERANLALSNKFELYGIKPSGGALDAATSCVCAKKPSSKVRKSLDMYVSWNDSLKDLRSRKLVCPSLDYSACKGLHGPAIFKSPRARGFLIKRPAGNPGPCSP